MKMNSKCVSIFLFPFRMVSAFVGLFLYGMDCFTDWILGVSRKTQYVRQGACLRCGRCCKCLALIMPKGMARHHWMVKLANAWHSLFMNFEFLSEEEGWLIYSCRYYRDSGCSSKGGCPIHWVKPRLCRSYPKARLYDHQPVHPECGYSFVRREVLEREHYARAHGLNIFREELERMQEK
jgi:Fe-S-cluster containining protein